MLQCYCKYVFIVVGKKLGENKLMYIWFLNT